MIIHGDNLEVMRRLHAGNERTGYPTQKPEELLHRIVSSMSYAGDTVLDPYAGSGTTLAVAEKLGRRAIGIDVSPVAVRVAGQRLAAMRGPLFVGAGE